MKEFKYAFQMNEFVIFNVEFYTLPPYPLPRFITSITEFSPDKKRASIQQSQREALKIGSLARDFFDKWNKYYLNFLSEKEYTELLSDIEQLKEKYNYIERKFNGITEEIVALSKLTPKGDCIASKFDIGDIVKVVATGKLYPTNRKWIVENIKNIDLIARWAYGDTLGFPEKSECDRYTFKVEMIFNHKIFISRLSDGACYLIEESGLALINDDYHYEVYEDNAGFLFVVEILRSSGKVEHVYKDFTAKNSIRLFLQGKRDPDKYFTLSGKRAREVHYECLTDPEITLVYDSKNGDMYYNKMGRAAKWTFGLD